LISVVLINASGNTLVVARAALGSAAAAHSAGATVWTLSASTVVVPFAQNFFENRASQNFLDTVHLPDLRICAAQFFVTNSFGDSQASQQCYTTLADGGLRTLSGGQLALQIAGTLSTQQNAAPSVLAPASHAVRDIRATVNEAPAGYSIAIQLLQNGALFTSLTIPSGSTTSNIVDGVSLPALTEQGSLTVNVQLNPIADYSGTPAAGSGLTVTVRL
jgi:hypothetical protein